MGAGQSIESNLWSSTFETESRNSQLGIIRLTDKQTEDNYICRKVSTLDKAQIQQYDRLIDIKLSIQSPYVTKLQRAQHQQNQQYCSYGKSYYLLFKQPFQTLKQQTLNRRFKNSMYSETQLQLMLEVGVKALSFLRNIDHPHQNVSSTAFFVNENRSLILGDPFMFPKENCPQVTRNGFVYPSPQLLKFQNHEVECYNRHLSDLFTFGLVLLEVFYMANMDCVYEKYFQRVDHEAIKYKLQGIRSQELRKKLFILLDPEARNRQMIFKHYMKSIPSSQLFNKLSKEKFKRTVDRYNLATSEVTEWKNQMPVEYRLHSSQGKRTFSVSTTENNLNHQQKTQNNYERQYSGHNQVNHNSINPLNPAYQLPQKSQFTANNQIVTNISIPQRQSIASMPTNVWQQVPLHNSFRKQAFTNNSQLYNDQKPKYQFRTNAVKSPSYVPQFNPIQTSNKPTTYLPNTNSNFSYQTPLYNNTPLPYTSPNLFAKANSFTPKDPINYTISHTISFNNYNNPNLNERKTTYEPPTPHQNSHPLYHTQQQSPLASVINPLPIFGKVIDSNDLTKISQQQILKSQFAEINNQQPQDKQIETQQQLYSEQKDIQQANQQLPTTKKDSSTPHKEKHKRLSSDYAKLHHLSTINQRSQMNQSFQSDSQQPGSQILIQEDQPNNLQPQRQYNSQQANTQNPLNLNQQNKIWSITYPSGTKYIGQIRNQKRNGLGTFFYMDGSKYHGHWLNNKMNGFGTLYYPNGKIAYQGEWQMDNFHGKGKVFNDQIQSFGYKYHYQNCSDVDNFWLQYQGQLYQDRKQGRGTLRLANGEYFEGVFKNDQLNGVCKFHTIDNKVIQGRWENNRLVEILSEREQM